MTRYLSAADLVQINERMTAKWGGSTGVRDLGLLESAVARPQMGYYRDLLEEAAAFLESLLQNHPFIDGNKRTAVVGTAVFLRWNGYRLRFADREMYDWLMSLYERNQLRKDQLEAWIRAHALEVP